MEATSRGMARAVAFTAGARHAQIAHPIPSQKCRRPNLRFLLLVEVGSSVFKVMETSSHPLPKAARLDDY
jgi:hypothetical protein